MTVRRLVASSVTAWLVLIVSAAGWAQTVNGAIVDAGRRTKIPTPLNDSMVWLVNAMQEAYLAEAKG